MKTFDELLKEKIGEINYQTYFDILTPEFRQEIIYTSQNYADQFKPKIIGEYQFEQDIKNERDRLMSFPENKNIEFLAGWNAGNTFGISIIISKLK